MQTGEGAKSPQQISPAVKPWITIKVNIVKQAMGGKVIQTLWGKSATNWLGSPTPQEHIHFLHNTSGQEPKAGKLTSPGVSLILSC